MCIFVKDTYISVKNVTLFLCSKAFIGFPFYSEWEPKSALTMAYKVLEYLSLTQLLLSLSFSLFPFYSRYWPPKNSGFLTYKASPHLRAFALVVSYNCTTSGPDIHMVASLMAFH